jgi:hypothetical protein
VRTWNPLEADSVAAAHASSGPRRHRDVRAEARAGTIDPRWLRLGLAAVLGVVAGSMLFPTVPRPS